jgi:hypothetical protein
VVVSARVAADRASRFAHGDDELAVLKLVAAERIAAGQGQLDLGLDARAETGPLEVVGSAAAHLWDALCRAYDSLGFDQASGGDEVFRALVLARIIEPTSKLDALRVLEEVGVAAPSYATLNQHSIRLIDMPSGRRSLLLSSGVPRGRWRAAPAGRRPESLGPSPSWLQHQRQGSLRPRRQRSSRQRHRGWRSCRTRCDRRPARQGVAIPPVPDSLIRAGARLPEQNQSSLALGSVAQHRQILNAVKGPGNEIANGAEQSDDQHVSEASKD